MRHVAIALVVFGLLACREGAQPAGGSASQTELPDTLTLGVGDTVHFGALPLTFSGVLSDSRCPVDVVCPWSGNAEVEILLGPPASTDGPTHRLILNSTHGTREGVAYGLLVRLLELRPDADTRRPIPPDGYEARVEVRGMGD
jgi:hypothetical protein